MSRLLALPLLSVLLALACSVVRAAPQTYDDCILENMRGVTSDLAAKAIIRACRSKFPQTEPEESVDSEKLPPEAMKQLTGRVELFGNSLVGNLYNGTQDWTITEVTITITEKNRFSKLAECSEDNSKPCPDSGVYRVEVKVPPLASKRFGVGVNWDASKPFQWQIQEAKGYRQETD